MLPIESCDYITVCFLILMGQLSVFGHVSPNKAQISTDEIVNKYMLFTGREVRMGKTVAEVLSTVFK